MNNNIQSLIDNASIIDSTDISQQATPQATPLNDSVIKSESKEESKEESKDESKEESEKESENDSKEESEDESEPNKLKLLLGDIIEIIAPEDTNLNEKQFIISYIDSTQIDITNRLQNTTTLTLDSQQQLDNKNIKNILLLNRDSKKGYAAQNNLIKGLWIDLYFSGDYPAILSGEITNKDKDQIEIKLTNNEIIYLDFKYQGLPKNINLDKIVKRDPPSKQTPISDDIIQDSDASESTDDTEFKQRIDQLILDADDIKFGEKLDVIEMQVEVSQDKKRYGIETQTTDLLNDLLSEIPIEKRNNYILSNIHKSVERFKQLRQEFSIFNDNILEKPRSNNIIQNPLHTFLSKLNGKLYWILPVTQNIKKIYYDKDDDDGLVLSNESAYYDDLIIMEQSEDLFNIVDTIDRFKQNSISSDINNYKSYLRNITPHFVPYNYLQNITPDTHIINASNIICSVVNNLDDFESSIISDNEVNKKRFLLQQHDIGLDILKTEIFPNGTNVSKKIKATLGDTLNINSYIYLNKSAIEFSNITLPNTLLLTKCNLSLNYIYNFKIFQNTSYVNEIFVDSQYNGIDEINQITQLSPDISDLENFDDFIKKIIPNVESCFNILELDKQNILSITAAVDKLQPFLLYDKNITIEDYQFLIKNVNNSIDNWILNYNNTFNQLQSINIPNYSNNNLTLLNDTLENSDNILKLTTSYKLDDETLSVFSNSEFLTYINNIDNQQLFNNTVSLENINLMVPELDFDESPDTTDSIIDIDDIDNIDSDKTTSSDKECTTLLAKQYQSIEELQQDNNKEIQFDIEFDKTYYDTYSEYKSEINPDDPFDKQVETLQALLIDKTGMTSDNATADATAMILGYKPVSDGNYAIVVPNTKPKTITFFKRENKKWVQDTKLKAETLSEAISIFCKKAPRCVSVKDKCMQKSSDTEKDLVKSMSKKTQDSLTIKYRKDLQNIKSSIFSETENVVSRLSRLIKLNETQQLRYDTYRNNLGLDVTDVVIEKSPYSDILKLILSQNDIAKRLTNIAKFSNKYTRSAIEKENMWWRYCIKTNTKLLPTYIIKLATSFIEQQDYIATLNRITADQGTLASDGEAIIDKYSGWVISKIEFSTDEGYTVDGFKQQTREILPTSISENVFSKEIQIDPDKETIIKIINALSKYISIDTSNIQEFIITETLELFKNKMPSEKEFKRALKKQQEKKKQTKKTTYKQAYNQTLIVMTLSYLLVAIQTSIPALKTKKTFPGCIRSLEGYPTNNLSDKSGVEYIACVTDSIKSSIEPWDSIKRVKATKLVKQIESTIDKYIINKPNVKTLIANRLIYNKVKKSPIEEETDIANTWDTFLPELNPTDKLFTGVRSEIKDQLLNDIKVGSQLQLPKIDILRSKITYAALAINIAIDKIVKNNMRKEQALLASASGIPYLENACCTSETPFVYEYFVKRDKSIHTNNKQVVLIENALNDIYHISKPVFLIIRSNTRKDYPDVSNAFTEETIYKTFIYYCKYDSDIPISEELRAICGSKPGNYDENMDITETIESMKSEGKHFDTTTLDQLMSIVNEKNIINLEYTTLQLNYNILLKNIVEEQIQRQNKLSNTFYKNLLDILDVEKSKNVEKIRIFRNQLDREITSLKNNLDSFVKTNVNNKLYLQFSRHIQDLVNPSFNKPENINDSTNAVISLITTLPNIVKNNIYLKNIYQPWYWNISNTHRTDITNMIDKYYNILYKFYNNEDLNKLLDRFMHENDFILDLIENTNSGDLYNIDSKLNNSITTYYLINILNCLTKLINISNQSSISKSSKNILESSIASSSSTKALNEDSQQSSQESSIIEDLDLLQDIEIGNRLALTNTVAELITAFVSILHKENISIQYNIDKLQESINNSKEREKNKIVAKLTNMSDQQREIENMFKNHKIGDWSVGLQKGFKTYDPERYDIERTDVQSDIFSGLESNNIDSTTQNLIDMYQLDTINEMETERDIQHELDNEILQYKGEDDNIDDTEFDDLL